MNTYEGLHRADWRLLECAYNRLQQTLYTSSRISDRAPADPFKSYPLMMLASRSLCKKVTIRHTHPPLDMDPLHDLRWELLAQKFQKQPPLSDLYVLDLLTSAIVIYRAIILRYFEI